MPATSLLGLTNGVAGYRKKCVLNGINLQIREGDAIGLVGSNGAGKTTLMRVLAGAQPLWSGQLSICDDPSPPGTELRYFIRKGIVYVPSGGRIFGTLSVFENLKVVAPTQEHLERALRSLPERFPELAAKVNRVAALLSGGERQLLAIASALLLSPRVLLLDEPMLGLAPAATARVTDLLVRLRSETRLTFVATGQSPDSMGAAISTAHLLGRGSIQCSGTPSEIANAIRRDHA